jgi:putative effector of murein hydrolase
MAMLAVVVLCDGTRVYLQRSLVRRHAAEIFGTVIVSALFSLFATAKLAALLGVEAMLARSLLPRAVTVALALPMTETLGGSTSLTAAMVCFTGLMGAAFGQTLMNSMRIRDEISRGVTQAASSHGMGTAAMAASEPQALPFCAVTIAIMGTVSNLLLCIPVVAQALLAITG